MMIEGKPQAAAERIIALEKKLDTVCTELDTVCIELERERKNSNLRVKAWTKEVSCLKVQLEQERSDTAIITDDLAADVRQLERLLSDEQARLDWWIKKGAITLEDETHIMWRTILIFDGDIRAAIDEAMDDEIKHLRV